MFAEFFHMRANEGQALAGSGWKILFLRRQIAIQEKRGERLIDFTLQVVGGANPGGGPIVFEAFARRLDLFNQAIDPGQAKVDLQHSCRFQVRPHGIGRTRLCLQQIVIKDNQAKSGDSQLSESLAKSASDGNGLPECLLQTSGAVGDDLGWSDQHDHACEVAASGPQSCGCAGGGTSLCGCRVLAAHLHLHLYFYLFAASDRTIPFPI